MPVFEERRVTRSARCSNHPSFPMRAALAVLCVLAAALMATTSCRKEHMEYDSPQGIVLEVSTVKYPLPYLPPPGVQEFPMIGGDCPVHGQFFDFFRFNWSTDLEVSGFSQRTEMNCSYRLVLRGGVVRYIEQMFGAPPSCHVNKYYIDRNGKLQRVIHLCGTVDQQDLIVAEDRRILYGGAMGLPERIIVETYVPRRSHVEIIYHFDDSGRLLGREARNKSGELVSWLWYGRAAKEILHYDESGCLIRSDLLGPDNQAVVEAGVPLHVEWYGNTVVSARIVGPDGTVIPDDIPIPGE